MKMLEEYVSIPSVGGLVEFCYVTKGHIPAKEFTAKIEGKEIEYKLTPLKICPGDYLVPTRGIHVYCCEATEENLKIAEQYIEDRLIKRAGYDITYTRHIKYEVKEGAKIIEYYIPFWHFESASIWLIDLVESHIPDCDVRFAYRDLNVYTPNRAAAPAILTCDLCRNTRCFVLAWPDVKACTVSCYDQLR